MMDVGFKCRFPYLYLNFSVRAGAKVDGVRGLS